MNFTRLFNILQIKMFISGRSFTKKRGVNVKSSKAMAVETHIQLVEDILGEWKTKVGENYAGYKNHVYRMINFSLAFQDFGSEDREKIIIAGCFHDLGIWSDDTFDYLPPSIVRAKEYLKKAVWNRGHPRSS